MKGRSKIIGSTDIDGEQLDAEPLRAPVAPRKKPLPPAPPARPGADYCEPDQLEFDFLNQNLVDRLP